MTALIRGEFGNDAPKGPVIDTDFDVDGVTYVKPAPPLGSRSDFFSAGRPREDSTGLVTCPPAAITFPDLLHQDWAQFRATWCVDTGRTSWSKSAIRDYANLLFDQKLKAVLFSARECRPESIVQPRYVLAVTEVIGQNRANDLPHIAYVHERPGGKPVI